ncbi:MAG: zinc ribbon domain-containing protein [Candidatus Omnitrophica bacterium]|nr:zinc ribbon domain-containing protein [Candidatus Omnitrophota bacterium]
MKKRRFQRLELSSLLSVFKRPKIELKRFEKLEVDGHKIEIKITEEKRKYKACPKCQRNNPKDSLYCLYCNYIFEDIAEEVKGVELEPWQIKCPGCGKIRPRTEKYCLYCGWRISPLSEEETKISPEFLREKTGQRLLSQGEVINLTIDGKTYRSTDKNIPPDIKELMLKIKEEGYSKEMIDEWVKKKNIEKELKRRDLEERIYELRWQVFWRALGFIGLILFLIFYIWLRVRF